MTREPYIGATPEQLAHPMVRELLAIHAMFRRELETILEYVEALLAGEQPLDGPEASAQVGAVVQAGVRYSHMLHHHHTLESSMLFPALVRQDPESAPIVKRLNDEHDEIARLIDKYYYASQDLLGIEPAALNSDLKRLAEALHAHLAYEETHVCPLLTRFAGWS